MKIIPLTQGKIALVDDADYDRLNQWRWYAAKYGRTFYALRNSSQKNGKRRTIYMHRKILNLVPGDPKISDHVDGNGLNNQRRNLRTVTQFQNALNTAANFNSSSRFKGVSWDRSNKKWQVHIKVNVRKVFLGRFSDEISAALAYDRAANIHFAASARLNFPERMKSYA